MVSGDVLSVTQRRSMIDTVCLCHSCHKEMEIGLISPFLEWHICDECMGKA